MSKRGGFETESETDLGTRTSMYVAFGIKNVYFFKTVTLLNPKTLRAVVSLSKSHHDCAMGPWHKHVLSYGRLAGGLAFTKNDLDYRCPWLKH